MVRDQPHIGLRHEVGQPRRPHDRGDLRRADLLEMHGPMGKLRYHANASPGYLERHFPAGVTPEAIANAPALTFNQKDRLQHEWVRQALGQDVTFPTHWLPSTQSFVDASLAGMGWALNPVQLVREHLASGRLVELVAGATLDRPLSWQVNRLAADHLSDLTRHVLVTARRELT